MSRINWDSILPEFVKAIEFLRNQLKTNPNEITFRTIFYHLGSRNVIPITLQAYKSLNRAFVRWRKQKKISFEMVYDMDRVTDKQFNVKLDALDGNKLNLFRNMLEKRGNEILSKPNELIDNILSNMFDYLLPSFQINRWYGQENICEVWSEKKSLRGIIKSIVNGLGINLRFSRGYFGWEFIYQGIKDMQQYFDMGYRKVYIFYIGDLDPSGVDIERHVQEAMEMLGIPRNKIVFKRLAVLPEQVKKYKLPPRPETEETIKKLLRDTRSVRYFGLSSYRELRSLTPEQLLRIMDETGKVAVEAEALFGTAPSEARKLIRQAILSVWDRKIYEKYQEEARKLRAEAEKILRDFKKAFKPKLINILKEKL